jgi:glycosyltransferase involved in cell wall biosynthesis
LISPEKVPEYLVLSDMLWHLSLHEGLPRSVVQSMACGNPAIGFRLDGTPEVVLDGVTGYCTEPENIAEVAERTLALLADPKAMKQMGENGRELVREQFTHQHMADVLEEAYLELASLRQ